jgi:FtsH-binding integral membrane protein
MPVAENRIARGPHPELLDALPEGFAPLITGPDPELNDALEQTYRQVLARALALAGCALLLAAATAFSLNADSSLQRNVVDGLFSSALSAQLVLRAIFVVQLLFVGICSRYVEKLSIAPAAVLLFAYAIFCALEFSALLPSTTLAVAFLCAGLMYTATAAWGFVRHFDLARPVTGFCMILAGGVILVAINLLAHTPSSVWTVTSLAVVVFAGLAACHAQQIRDFYQDFDDDNAEGWKASVLGALLLLINSVNIYFLLVTFLPSKDQDDSTDRL